MSRPAQGQLRLLSSSRCDAPADSVAGRKLARRRRRREIQSRYWRRLGGRWGQLAEAIATGDQERSLRLARRMGLVRCEADRRELRALVQYVRRTGRRPAALARWALRRSESWKGLASQADEDRTAHTRRRSKTPKDAHPQVLGELVGRILEQVRSEAAPTRYSGTPSAARHFEN